MLKLPFQKIVWFRALRFAYVYCYSSANICIQRYSADNRRSSSISEWVCRTPLQKHLLLSIRIPSPRVILAYKTFCVLFANSIDMIVAKSINAMTKVNSGEATQRTLDGASSPNTARGDTTYRSNTLREFYNIIIKVPSYLPPKILTIRRGWRRITRQ